MSYSYARRNRKFFPALPAHRGPSNISKRDVTDDDFHSLPPWGEMFLGALRQKPVSTETLKSREAEELQRREKEKNRQAKEMERARKKHQGEKNYYEFGDYGRATTFGSYVLKDEPWRAQVYQYSLSGRDEVDEKKYNWLKKYLKAEYDRPKYNSQYVDFRTLEDIDIQDKIDDASVLYEVNKDDPVKLNYLADPYQHYPSDVNLVMFLREHYGDTMAIEDQWKQLRKDDPVKARQLSGYKHPKDYPVQDLIKANKNVDKANLLKYEEQQKAQGKLKGATMLGGDVDPKTATDALTQAITTATGSTMLNKADLTKTETKTETMPTTVDPVQEMEQKKVVEQMKQKQKEELGGISLDTSTSSGLAGTSADTAISEATAPTVAPPQSKDKSWSEYLGLSSASASGDPSPPPPPPPAAPAQEAGRPGTGAPGAPGFVSSAGGGGDPPPGGGGSTTTTTPGGRKGKKKGDNLLEKIRPQEGMDIDDIVDAYGEKDGKDEYTSQLDARMRKLTDEQREKLAQSLKRGLGGAQAEIDSGLMRGVLQPPSDPNAMSHRGDEERGIDTLQAMDDRDIGTKAEAINRGMGATTKDGWRYGGPYDYPAEVTNPDFLQMQNMVLKKENAARKKGARHISLWSQTHTKGGLPASRPSWYSYHHGKDKWKRLTVSQRRAWIQKRRDRMLQGTESHVPYFSGLIREGRKQKPMKKGTVVRH